MIAVATDILNGALLAAFVVVAALFIRRVIAHIRRHHPLGNRLFMRRYRAEHPAVVRRHTPADAGGPRPPASAGSIRGRRTR